MAKGRQDLDPVAGSRAHQQAPVGNLDGWVEKAEQHPGSWWPDWLEWINVQDPAEVPARAPGGGKYAALEEAPGSYVRVRD